MNRADRSRRATIAAASAVGFALTTLQRRLASSPAAIHRSLERRKSRLQAELREARMYASVKATTSIVPDDWEDLEDLTDEEREATGGQGCIAGATSARHYRKNWKLRSPCSTGLAGQVGCDRRPRLPTPSGTRFAAPSTTADEMRDDTGARRKVIIFTEHKDTLDDLAVRLPSTSDATTLSSPSTAGPRARTARKPRRPSAERALRLPGRH